jgi:hypothetical protein
MVVLSPLFPEMIGATGPLSLVPPAEVQDLFGNPALLRGEDVELYNKLMGQFASVNS